MRNKRKNKIWVLPVLSLLIAPGLWAEEEEVAELETFVAEEAVEDDIGIIPTGPIESIFGFDKTLLETPRSASVISIETMEQFGITEIDDLIVLAPGSFTQSFFGAAGALDLRGTPGEVYFNGIRRLENPGNYATPIGAADRVSSLHGSHRALFKLTQSTIGAETFRVCREFVDEMVTVSNDDICAAIKDGFTETRCVLEPAGALGIAGVKKWVEQSNVRDKSFAVIASGANMDFDRLRFVSGARGRRMLSHHT